MKKMKVVAGDTMFFKDDIQIIDAELAVTLNIPSGIPVFSRDEFQILYNGHVFVAAKDKDDDMAVKVYTENYGLKEIESPKEQEEKYFFDNKTLVDKLKSDFIDMTVNGISILNGASKSVLPHQISSELVERITNEYGSYTQSKKYHSPPGKGNITKNDDGSIFNSYIHGYERMLLLDGNVYNLSTMPEYISIFQKSFEKEFYKEIQEKAYSATPEEVSHMLNKNSDKIYRKALPAMRNKIWNSNRSFKLFLDGICWIPMHKEKVDDIIGVYEKLLERQIKIDAAKEFV